MEVLKLILENIDNIAAVVIMFIIVIALVKKGETDVLKEILFSLITKAEEDFGAGAGVLKFATVADWLYERIPSMLKPLFTSKDIEKLIENALIKAKTEWEENPDVYAIIPQKDDPYDSDSLDVIEGYFNAEDGKFYKEPTYQTEIIPETNKVYVTVTLPAKSDESEDEESLNEE